MLRGVNVLSKFQLPSSSGLWYFEDYEEKAHLMSDEADCRTARATPGLLNILFFITNIGNIEILL